MRLTEKLDPIAENGQPRINLEAMQNIAFKIALAFLSRHFAVAFFVLWSALTSLCNAARADDWMTWPSSYTHEPNRGQRIDQYALPVQPVVPHDPSFQRSGYRHYRSTLQGGNSADNMHVVEQWGAPVVPYEQWRFPFRPYGVPYDAWGPQAPYGIINGNFNANFGPGIGYPGNLLPQGVIPGGPMSPTHSHYYGNSNQGYPGPGNMPQPPSNGFPLSPPYQNQPWFDGSYPFTPPLDNRTDAEFFYTPKRQ